MSDPFIAEIRIFAGNFAPRGWAFCDGQLLPIAQNTALFSLIGTTFGGDGRSTTALPDMKDRAPMHPGRGPGLTPRRLGEKVGASTAALTEAQLPSHSHNYGTTTAPGSSTLPMNNALNSRSVGRNIYAAGAPDTVMNAGAVSNSGGGQAHNNLQPYLGINFIIALVGLFPSRS